MKAHFLLGLCVIASIFSAASGAQEVTYLLGQGQDVLDAAFYAGDASDNSEGGRFTLWGRLSNSGTTIAFFAINANTYDMSIFLVDVGASSSWRRLTPDMPFQALIPLNWSPDDTAIITSKFRIPLATGQWESYTPFGVTAWEPSVETIGGDHWLFGRQRAIPIWANGIEDPSRGVVEIFDIPTTDITFMDVSPDGQRLAFVDWRRDTVPSGGDIYVIPNLPEILAAPKVEGTDISSLAVTSLDDPRLIHIRVEETENVAVMPRFSQDSSSLYYCEDWNNVYSNADFFGSMAFTNWDIMISNADGSGEDIRLAQAGNQSVLMPSSGGTRFLYLDAPTQQFHLYLAIMETVTTVSGDPVGTPEENKIEIVAPQEIADTSGTEMTLPVGVVVDFPDGAPQEIQITTPIAQVTEPQLPENVNAIPVLREFGPAGTVFSQPIPVTIQYTDGEVAGLDEDTLRVFVYNEETGVFDIEITDIIARDTINNTITFGLSHFSTIGLAGKTPPMPLTPGFMAIQALLIGLLGCRYARRRPA